LPGQWRSICCAIAGAHDGLTALTKLRAGKRYGLAISDWNMEPMSGYDLLCEIRRDETLKRTPSSWLQVKPRPT
jgi:CheY-like chemotaxis protein